MPLSTELRLEIITLLLPLPQVQDEPSRRALLTTAFGNSPPANLISHNGATATFVPLLVHTLDGFGDFEPGLPALAHLLQILRPMVGVDVQSRIDALITQILSAPAQTQVNTDPSSVTATAPTRESLEAASSKRFFISYRHTEPDQTLAHTLADALGQAGHIVFIDTGIRWGEEWAKRINDALKVCDFLVLLLSHESAQSEMVAEEVNIAVELRRKAREAKQTDRPVILPIRIRYPFSDPLPYELSARLRHIQQVSWNDESDTARILNLLLQTVGIPNEWQGDTEPQPVVDPRLLTQPGGGMNSANPFYIVRGVQERISELLQHDRGFVTLRGARQTGKTSLLLAVQSQLREEGIARCAYVDFQLFEAEDMQSPNTVWRAIARRIADRLEIDAWSSDDYRLSESHDRNLNQFLRRHVFKDDKTPLLLCLDEVDRLFGSSVGDAFFPTLRAYYNEGADSPTWGRMRWLISTSTEPAFFIVDKHTSPFNIGMPEISNRFTFEEVKALAGKHGQLREADAVWNYVGGHPYLTHTLFYHLARKRYQRDALFDARTAGGGALRDHLHRFLLHFQKEPALAQAMRDIVRDRGCDNEEISYRIEAAGLARRDTENRCIPFCSLYREFFLETLFV